MSIKSQVKNLEQTQLLKKNYSNMRMIENKQINKYLHQYIHWMVTLIFSIRITKSNNTFIIISLYRLAKDNNQSKWRTIVMNVNKMELSAQLGLKQEAGLKCMEFATQYMLKKAQYRLLNPLHTNECSLLQLHQESQLMAELNAYCVPNPVMLSKSVNLNMLQLIQQRPSIRKSNRLKQQPKHQQLLQQQLPKASQSSVSEYTHPIIQRTSSQIISNRSSKSSPSQKKSRSKFQKVIKKSSEQQQNVQETQRLDFKKKKLPQLTKQQVVNKQQQDNQQSMFSRQFTDSDDDSFDNLPLPSAQKQQNNPTNQKQYSSNNRQSIKSQDLESYHSSIIVSQKKILIDIVSEHLSQNQISILDGSQIPQRKIRSEQQQRQQSLKKSQQQQQDNQNKEQNYQLEHSRQQQQQDYVKEKQQLLEQIRRDLMKLESFDLQQQILMKRLLKIWNVQSQSIQQVKNLTWHQLNLPKPTFRPNLHLYAQIIE